MGSGHPQSTSFTQQLIDQYPSYKQQALTHRRFKHQDLQPLISDLAQRGFRVEEEGRSYQGRTIHTVSIGQGTLKVLMWSQMHGDEATATMALFDLFNYLTNSQSPEVKRILEQTTLCFVPMLNPDGAERFQRRTAQGIDMNRDALALQCPESRLLKQLRQKLQPDFAFNLHDQNNYYTVGLTGKPATISFLAPALDPEKSVNEGRLRAMQVVAAMHDALQKDIPGQVAKYDDSFEPRAFGDNMQKWGSSTILIESGAYPGDVEKQQVRMLNYLALVTALKSMAEGSYAHKKEQDYFGIPENRENLHDLLIKGIQLDGEGGNYQLDVAVRRQEYDTEGGFPMYYVGRIEDAGDLQTKFGFKELAVPGLEYQAALIYPHVLENIAVARELPLPELLHQGYTALRLKNLPAAATEFCLDLLSTKAQPKWGLGYEQFASFVLKRGDKVEYAVINGFLHKIGENIDPAAHGCMHR